MGMNKVEDFFVDNVKQTVMGEALGFYSIRDVARAIKDDTANVRKYVKSLLSCNALVEHPFNHLQRVKRYRLSRDYYVKNYLVNPNITSDLDFNTEKTRPNGV